MKKTNSVSLIDLEIVGGCLTIILSILIIVMIPFVRLDFASGSHLITPTAVDNDMWGNYKVYYKTSEYTQNSQEDFYYIEKGNTELAEQMRKNIKEKKSVIVYYDKYIGFKGLSAPGSAPITRIEELEDEE